MRLKSLCAFPAAILVCVLLSLSAIAEERLEGGLEDRARALFSELRCVVCQNQSIDESDADVAKDLRAIVREQIVAGKTDKQVRAYLVNRYGEFILLNPVVAWHTIILWLTPLLLLIGAFAALYYIVRNRGIAQTSTLSEEEERQLAKMLSKRD